MVVVLGVGWGEEVPIVGKHCKSGAAWMHDMIDDDA